MTAPGSLELKVALELDAESILTDSWDVEATVLFRVQRVLKEGETHLVGDPFGGLMKMLPEAQQKEFAEKMTSGDAAQLGLGDVQITGPAIVGTPIAIYR